MLPVFSYICFTDTDDVKYLCIVGQYLADIVHLKIIHLKDNFGAPSPGYFLF